MHRNYYPIVSEVIYFSLKLCQKFLLPTDRTLIIFVLVSITKINVSVTFLKKKKNASFADCISLSLRDNMVAGSCMHARKSSERFCVSSDTSLAKFTGFVSGDTANQIHATSSLSFVWLPAGAGVQEKEGRTYARHNNMTFAHRVTNDRHQSIRTTRTVMWTRTPMTNDRQGLIPTLLLVQGTAKLTVCIWSCDAKASRENYYLSSQTYIFFLYVGKWMKKCKKVWL